MRVAAINILLSEGKFSLCAFLHADLIGRPGWLDGFISTWRLNRRAKFHPMTDGPSLLDRLGYLSDDRKDF